MVIRKKEKQIIFLLGSIILFLYFLFKMLQITDDSMTVMYNSGLLALASILIIFNVVYSLYPMDIFDPFPLTTGIYLMIFAICPMSDVLNDTTAVYGFNPVGGAFKGTLIFIASYVAFTIGYISKKKYCNYNYYDFTCEQITVSDRSKVLIISYFLWIIGLAGTFIYMTGNGLSIKYILSLGIDSGSDIVESSGSPLGFIGMLTFTMITSCVYIMFYEKNKLITAIIFAVTMACLLVRGFRSIIIILMVAPIIYYYVKNGKRPKLITVLIMLFIVVLMIGAVGFVRNDLRAGEGASLQEFNKDVVIDTLMDNFRRYNIFYGMVEALPSKHNYTFGKNFLYTITMIIPRIIWPGKPQPVMSEILTVSTNATIASTGAAWPNIGEYYMEFGIPGCIIIMYFMGRVFSRLRASFNSEAATPHSLMGYSVFIPSLVTIIAYGYTPSTAYMIIFLLIPIFVMKLTKC